MYEEYFHEDPFTKEKYPQSIYHNEPQLKYLGDPTITRVDAGEKVTGQAKFANDMVFPDALYLKFKRCPYSHARVTSVDTSAAKALPGVVKVLTHADVPDLLVRPPYHYAIQEECYHEGAEVAAVAAEDEDIAEEALALIDVEYEVRPFVLYAKEAMEPGAPVIFGDTNEVGNPANLIDRGDYDSAFTSADIQVEGQYDSVTAPWTGERDCAPIEAETLTAIWNGKELIAWDSSQNPYGDSRTIAAQLGLPYTDVRCPPCYSGVGFGNKGTNSKGKVLAAWLARETNRPVKWRGDNTGQFSTGRSCQNGQHLTIKTGMSSDGTVTSFIADNICNSGSYGGRAATDSHLLARALINTPNMHLTGRDFATNTQGCGVPRCVGHPMPSHMLNVHLDECAEAANISPAEFWRKNIFTGTGLGGDPDNPDWDIGVNPQPAQLEQVLALSNFDSKWKGWGTPVATNGIKKRGIGMAIHLCRHGYLANPESATVKANLDGTWNVTVGSRDVGQGWRTQGAIFAAEELGVPPSDVIGARVDTAIQQESRAPGGSTVTRGSGTPLILACRDAKKQMFELAIAAGLIEAGSAEELESADGFIYLKSDPETKVEVKTVLARQQSTHVPSTLGGPIIGRGSYATKRDRWMHRQYDAAVAEVEVNTETGEVEVLDIWHDCACGRVVWRKGIENQVYGGTIMSMSKGIYEGTVKDEATGITLNPNYLDYKLATHMDVPRIHASFTEQIDTYGPFGAHGVAEPICGPNSPAVANAIYNAVGGTRIRSVMNLPDRVLKAMGKA
jgi:CO/xanthine dehydrogenase Mo-binding subunit